jgi:peptidylprolyl isomerase
MFLMFLVGVASWAQTPTLPGDGVFALIATAKGDILVQLEFQKTPITVASFVGLAEGSLNLTTPGKPYFDGLTFHRVEPGFVIQGGDPNGNGTGGPGYTFPNEYDATLNHGAAGILSMANAGPDTNGSQFFITLGAASHLDGGYTVFGHVVKGQDVVAKIQPKDVMTKVTILRQGAAAKAFVITPVVFSRLNPEFAQVLKESEGAKITASGLRYVVLKDSTGRKPKSGQKITANYEGKLLNGFVFDSSYTRNQPIQFAVGTGQVIKGWDEALLDMKVGEKRKLIIPPALGYGARGNPQGKIPPNSWLVFTVELVGILE